MGQKAEYYSGCLRRASGAVNIMSMFQVGLPSYVQTVLNRLQSQGHSAYVVGGSLRDLLLGGTPHDWDVTTSARPEETMAAFADVTTIPTGLKHGTVTVLIEHVPIEITTYRIDGSYTDSRRPDSVTFTDRLAEDLARRDFTVNAMAYAPCDGLIDLYGGQEDLKAGILRAVGEPVKRFTEDALRILRGFRFSAQLNFAIEPETLAAMSETREGLRRISAERIFAELSRLLISPAAPRGWLALCESGALPIILPHIAARKNEFTNMAEGLSQLPPDLSVRMAWLFWGMPLEEIRADLNALKPPTRLKEDVLLLIEFSRPPVDITPPAVRRTVRHYGDLTDGVLSLWACAGYDVTLLQQTADAVRTEGFCRTIAELAVSGNDLVAEAGVPRDKRLGETLRTLLEHVTDHPEENRRERLIELAREFSES